jgi:hypothetical protein
MLVGFLQYDKSGKAGVDAEGSFVDATKEGLSGHAMDCSLERAAIFPRGKGTVLRLVPILVTATQIWYVLLCS